MEQERIEICELMKHSPSSDYPVSQVIKDKLFALGYSTGNDRPGMLLRALKDLERYKGKVREIR